MTCESCQYFHEPDDDASLNQSTYCVRYPPTASLVGVTSSGFDTLSLYPVVTAHSAACGEFKVTQTPTYKQ